MVKINTSPVKSTAALVFSDGLVLRGVGIGAEGQRVGELCFNTSMSGYQEILTDPSYAGQIITFTFPHIGNVGANLQDIETTNPVARGMVLRADVTDPSNYRATRHLEDWMRATDLVGIAGLDTRRLTRRIRDGGPPKVCLVHAADGAIDVAAAQAAANDWPGLEGMDLAGEVSCKQTYRWDETRWSSDTDDYGRLTEPKHHVVAVDFGAKRNILRSLASVGCAVTVVPAQTSAEDILAHRPDGIFLANGPGDPAATGVYAKATVTKLVESGLPLFGICLGHQILALSLGARTTKMHQGHRGANHPVKDMTTGKVEITSQNHGFVVDTDSLPDGVEQTHVSLFDGSNEGIALRDRPVFSVQYHPEASPGPHDSHYLFKRFVSLMEA
ncbi:MAG: glutamine-hydrolyzing carbamoyl-phosphate synthase small subunit [Pseudomonadota bacterium]